MARSKTNCIQDSTTGASRDQPHRPPQIRVARNVPKLIEVDLNLRLARPFPAAGAHLIGPPLSGFAFTPQERAQIAKAAPSLPERDRHGIEIIDVKLAYLVEDYIERIKEFSRRDSFKDVQREMGSLANPGKGRRREMSELSSTTLHLLAGKFMRCANLQNFTQSEFDATINKLRSGSFPQHEITRKARGILSLGALKEQRDRAASPTSNEPFRMFASHLFNEWRFGLSREPKISRDAGRRQKGDPQQLTDGDAVCSELVMLAQALQAIAVNRLLSCRDFIARFSDDRSVIMTPSEVYFSMRRVLSEMRTNDKDGTGRFFCVGRRDAGEGPVIPQLEAKFRALRHDVQEERRAACQWLELGSSVRRRSKRRGGF